MFLGELLVEHGAVSQVDLDRALDRQKESGGLLGDNLVALGLISDEEIKRISSLYPRAPKSIDETGLGVSFLLNLMLKFMYIKGLERPSQIAEAMRLPIPIIDALFEAARERLLVEVLGAAGVSVVSEYRYGMTTKGRDWAREALEQSQYIGPAPIPLESYCTQIERQSIRTDRVARETLMRESSNLVLPPGFLDNLGPAINSGRAILLYGAPGNGKSSLADAMGRCFKGLAYIPYAVEIDGQVMKVFDPVIHQPAGGTSTSSAGNGSSASNGSDASNGSNGSTGASPTLLRKDVPDLRWVPCKRPILTTGGELTLEMLDLSFSEYSKLYEAPLQVKAMNGVFIIDDFGRQMARPESILNRWIIPLERRIDYLTLHTGKKFTIPFDALIVFSTNMKPQDLMDEAFLRRIPYKVHMASPSPEDFTTIFQRVSAANGLEIPPGLIEEILRDMYQSKAIPLASYHPKFITDRIIDRARYAGEAPHLDRAAVEAAAQNLFVGK